MMNTITIVAGAVLIGVSVAVAVFSKRSGKKFPLDIIITLSASGVLIPCLGMIPYDEDSIMNKMAEVKQSLQEMPGSPAPEFSGTTLDGREMSLSDYTGKGNYVLLDFWASWCSPCKKFMPIIRKTYDEYSAKGLVIIGVNVNDKSEKAREYIEHSDMVWDILITEGSSVMSLYKCTAIPSCYLVSPDGIILEVGVHPIRLKETIKKYFEDEQ